ncbi:hypothetical protein FBEOM_8000 [Fusarium beomiforme]|uniref:Uncharacterized protein n=1 Tax=Fusarium beomiforme TaxID=44412 RepID=A0A9P5AGF0_9HYPO|nr:hypothetical protein FBEOM_8000 [Fusarium beomiforme]
MANREFFYFYAPTWDYPPHGPIKLGNIISSVKKPHIPLINCPPAEDAGVYKTEKKKVQYTKEKLTSGKFSVLTKFLSVLGFGVDVGAEVERSDEETFMFDTLETTGFIPTSEYLQHCVESEAVRGWLEKFRYSKPLYVITGLKVVTGAAANTFKSRTVGGDLSVEVDGTVWSGGAVPIGGGPGIEAKVGQSHQTKWEGGNFVFAFRVSKVRVKKSGEVKSEEEYTKGTMLEPQSQVHKQAGLDIIALEDPSARDEGFEEEKLMEDDDEILCAIPQDEDSDDE